MKRIIIALTLVLLTLTVIQAEQVELNNGDIISGIIISANDSSITIDTGFGTTMNIQRTSISSISFYKSAKKELHSYRSRLEVESTDFHKRSQQYNSCETDFLINRLARSSTVMGVGIGFSTLGITAGTIALLCLMWIPFVSIIPGILSLLMLAPGLPMWIGGGTVRSNLKQQIKMMSRMSLDTGNNSAPVLSSSLLKLPIS